MIDPRITDSIPHRPPMLLIDSIEQLESNSITCSKTFRADEYFFQGHFPDHPVVPGVILCECAAQAGAVLLFQNAGNDADGTTPLLTRMSNVRFKQMIEPNDVILIEVKLDEQISTAWLMSARIRKNNKLAASVNFTCTIKSHNAKSP